MHASAIAVQGTGPAAAYAQFRAAVARAQITRWLAGFGEAGRPTLVDISGPAAFAAELAADSGHTVLRVLPPASTVVPPANAAEGTRRPGEEARYPGEGTWCPDGVRRPGEEARCSRKRLRLIAGDTGGLDFLTDGCADGVLAEDGTLSRNLAAETLVSEIARVLRPGGRVLACVNNLTLGMAMLAQQNAWPRLIDLPHADVVLVPWPDGTITRCYGAEQLRELFTAAGFEVRWIRPRTMFAPRAVSYLLARDPRSFPRLLSAELRARSDDSVGDQLVISARRRLPTQRHRGAERSGGGGSGPNAHLGRLLPTQTRIRHVRWAASFRASVSRASARQRAKCALGQALTGPSAHSAR